MCEILKYSIHERLLSAIRERMPQWEDLLREEDRLYMETGDSREQLRLYLDEDDSSMTVTLPSIREMFRGNRNPGEFPDYPEEYIPFFCAVEIAVVRAVREGRIPLATDDAFIEVYSAMRRRPDGRSLGQLHDLVWSEALFFLLTRECSRMEYEACFQKLERGVRKFHFDYSSHNYLDHLLGDF